MDSLHALKIKILDFFPSNARLVSGGAWALVGRFLSLFLGLVINVILVRILTPEEMGSFVLTLSIVSIGVVFGQFGLGRTSVRLIAESIGLGQPDRARKLVAKILLATVAGAILSGALILLKGQWLAAVLLRSNLISGGILLTGLWVFTLTIKTVLVEVFRGFHLISYSEIFSDLGLRVLLIPVLVWLWLAKRHLTFEHVLVLFISLTILLTLIGLFMLGRLIGSLPRTNTAVNNEPGLKTIFFSSLNVWLSSLLLVGQGYAVVWLLAAYTTPAVVAQYYSAFQLASLIGVFMMVLQSVLPPIVAELYAKRSLFELQNLLQKSAFVAFLPSALVFIVLMMSGKFILSHIYGEYYSAAFPFLVILCVGQLVNVWTGLCGETLIQTGNQNILLAIIFWGMLTSFSVSMLFYRFYGGVGIILMITLSTIFINFLSLLFVWKKNGIWTFARP